MSILDRRAALAAGAVFALAGSAFATSLPFATGFEAAEGYTSGSQLATNANWTGDGQDTSGWQITNSTIGGSAAASGAQWVLASGATASVSKFQWTVTPVTDFSVLPAIIGSADVKIVSPASGTVNRNTYAGIQMYNAAVSQLCSLTLIHDVQNTSGLGAGRMLLEFDSGDGTTFNLYDLGVSNAINQYINLKLVADIPNNKAYAFLNNAPLPDVGNLGGKTDFHDFDLWHGGSSTSGGTRGRAGFDNYSIAQGQVPTPGALALVGVAGLVGGRRRRR